VQGYFLVHRSSAEDALAGVGELRAQLEEVREMQQQLRQAGAGGGLEEALVAVQGGGGASSEYPRRPGGV